MSKKTFDRLTKAQQDVLIAAGKKAQKYYEDKAESVDAATIKAYKDHGVEIRSLSDAEYNQWIDVARKSSYAEFSKDVPDGKKLIDEALSVK
jgi:TRAP-type C4-dicarboxylate transport system substrate-binding protein